MAMDAAATPQAFLEYLALQRLASRHTLDAYRRDLARLVALAGSQADDDPSKLGAPQLRRGLMRMHAQGLAPRSIARVLSAWRSYYAWLAGKRLIAANPADGLRAPKRARLLPKALAVDQAVALLEAPADSVLEQRDAAMFELFYSSGLRLAELAGLDETGHIDLQEGLVTVLGKRRKTRTVPVGSQAIAALQKWLARRPQLARAGEKALFLSRDGERLSARQIQNRLALWAKRSGLGLHVHPHMLRHSVASHLLQSSGDLRAVQEMLGHASVAATQIYTHLDFQHLARTYDAAHPRAKGKPVT